MTLLVIAIAAYFLGSIPFGLLLTKAFGRGDVRKAGSGNIGATNVARAAGWLAGVLTLVLDATKGAGAVFLAEKLSNDSATWMMIAAFAALAITGFQNFSDCRRIPSRTFAKASRGARPPPGGRICLNLNLTP